MCPAAGYAFFGGARGPRPTGRYVEPRVGDGVLPWSEAEQMPLGYDVPIHTVLAPPLLTQKKKRPRAFLFFLRRRNQNEDAPG